MKIAQSYTVTLTHEEACALKVVLGKRSQQSDLASGLTEKDSEFLSSLYDYLPNRDE